MRIYFATGKFLPFIKCPDDRSLVLKLREDLRQTVDNLWTGEWYAKNNADCVDAALDLKVQAWAVLSGIADSKKAQLALKSVAERLIDYDNGIIKPHSNKTTGNVNTQSSNKKINHEAIQDLNASLLYILALIQEGASEFAYRLLEMLNPFYCSHAISAEKISDDSGCFFYSSDSGNDSAYDIADSVQKNPAAAGWYYKCIVENILGLSVQKDKIYFAPALPVKIKKVKIKFKTQIGVIDVEIDNTDSNNIAPGSNNRWCVQIDKTKYSVSYILITRSIIGKKVVIKRN